MSAKSSSSSSYPPLQVPVDAKILYIDHDQEHDHEEDVDEDHTPQSRMQLVRYVESCMNYCDDSVTATIYTRRDVHGKDDSIHGAQWIPVPKRIHNARWMSGGKGTGNGNGIEGHRQCYFPMQFDRHGFQLVSFLDDPAAADADANASRTSSRNNSIMIDFRNSQQVIDEYYPQCINLVRKITGATIVHCFDHNVRVSDSSSGQLEGDTTLQQPVGIVHNDYTVLSASRRLQQLGQPPKANDSMKRSLGDRPLVDPAIVRDVLEDPTKRRFVFCNVWRNIDRKNPVLQYPLACTDATTQQESSSPSSSSSELVTFQIHYTDRIGENYFSKHSHQHEWYYFPQMTYDEAILLKQWDSHGTMARQLQRQQQQQQQDRPMDNMPSSSSSPSSSSFSVPIDDTDHDFVSTFSLHSAFRDPSSPPDAPPRQSIEVRCVLIW